MIMFRMGINALCTAHGGATAQTQFDSRIAEE